MTPGSAQECQTFVVLEVTGQSPFAPATRTSLHQSLGWNGGLAVNIADAWAVGGVVGYAFASESTRHQTASLRVQRWLNPGVAVALSPGAFRLVDKGFAPADDRIGYNAALHLMLYDVGLVGLRLDALPGSRGATPEHAVSAVAGLQSLPALIGSVLGGLAIIVAIGAAIGAAG